MVETRPQSLRPAVRMALRSRYPVLLTLGPEYFQLYNDAYSRPGSLRRAGAPGGAAAPLDPGVAHPSFVEPPRPSVKRRPAGSDEGPMQTFSDCARLMSRWLLETERRAAALLEGVHAAQPGAGPDRLRELKAIEAAGSAIKEDAARLRPDWTGEGVYSGANTSERLADARAALKSVGARLLEADSRVEDLGLPALAFPAREDVEAYVDLQFRALEAALAPG